MKLLRYGPQGSEKPGLMDDKGQIRDLSEVVKDIDPDFFAGDGLRKVAALDVSRLSIVQGSPRIGACIRRPGNFIAVGLNYVQHAIETNAPIPSEPILFNKAPSCISGPFDPVTLPVGSVKSDWEVELAIVIGRDALYVSEESALDYVAGYCICNDVSERESQLEHGGQWVKGKMFPTFGPLGPWLVTKDEIADVQELKLWLELNGKRVQDSSTNDMIFPIKKLVSYISQFVALQPGDVITTGTPPGVGLGMHPEVYLKAGDTMKLGIEGLGMQEQKVVNWAATQK
ncbi:fumarylacetoacetate hydrolase family protein [Caballeronia sp. SEWSISQ10-4 2]|uniref:fumarylacetoacetate hydrolase family protein n=1 Tax=Caballeronia sp. SEWSISQ10-4 2 TaxID=2937438 RepID=UPI002651B22C|nr:fumarylacetoacetate hydrolase family protein [Caballeronia sp. SEWSISQ10-4 2]MDN7179761.1 fumarylacetoacetate hydrolase family protein [Caballeronia sp. SEWSISQ10-4 2]